MRINKKFGILALALGCACGAEAQTVYITGSTAFRAQIYNGLTDMGLTAQAGTSTKNNIFFFSGTINNTTIGTITNGSAGASVNILCSFSGSSEGLNTLINKVSPTYTNTSLAQVTYVNGADLSFCDVAQSATPYPTGAVNELSSVDGVNSSYGEGVAVVPFCWAASADAAAKVKNVTPYILNDIYPLGNMPLSYFTGVATDSPTNVVLIGRTNDSGTRITAQLTDGLPTASFDPAQGIKQYAVGGIAGLNAGTFTGTYSLLTGFAGSGFAGYSSGGSVAKALNVSGAGYGVGYVAFSDAGSLLNGALPINFEGVSPFVGSSWTANVTAWNFGGIENGSYYFWSYEHLYESSLISSPSFINNEFGPDLINALEYEIVHPQSGQIQTADLIGNLNVHKNNDGGDVAQGN
jgi:hypothetical protein